MRVLGRRHRPQRVPAVHRRGAGEHEHPAFAPVDLALIARELVALQLPQGSRAILAREQATDRHEVGVVVEAAQRRGQEAGRDGGVRVQDDEDIVDLGVASCADRAWLSAPALCWVLPVVSNTSTPCARATVAVASVQLSAMTRTRSGGRVCPTAKRGCLDGKGLVVGRHQDREPQRPVVGVRVRQPARWLWVDRKSERGWTEHEATSPAHLRRQWRRYPPVAHQDPHRCGGVAGGQPDEEGGRADGRRQDEGNRGDVVVCPEGKLSDDVGGMRPQRDPARQHQQADGHADERGGQPAEARYPAAWWGLIAGCH